MYTLPALSRREPGLLDAPLADAQISVDQFEFDQAQQIAGMIDAVASALTGDLVVFRRILFVRRSQRREQYPEQIFAWVRERAVRMVGEYRADYVLLKSPIRSEDTGHAVGLFAIVDGEQVAGFDFDRCRIT